MSTEEERDIIDLIDYAATKQSKRLFDDLDRLVDVGDRMIAQSITTASAKAENVDEIMEGKTLADFMKAE